MTRPLPAPPRLLVRLLAALYRGWYRTLRFRARLADGTIVTPDRYPFGPEIFALSEGDALALGGIVAAARFTVLVATGRDGDWATTALESLGGRVVRGATQRGGTRALAALLEHLHEHPGPLGLVVDGPLGPAGQARGGAIVCASHSGRPLRPLGAFARVRLVIPGSWSGIWLPLPFSRVAIVVGESLPVPARASRPERERLTRELTLRLAEVRGRARAEA